MKIAIVGSRDFPDMGLVREYVASLPKGTVVISGAARGVDRVAAEAARRRGLEVVEYPADWENHPKVAGFLRNQQIVDACDNVVAFWDGKSKGTQDTIAKAKKSAKPVDVIPPLPTSTPSA